MAQTPERTNAGWWARLVGLFGGPSAPAAPLAAAPAAVREAYGVGIDVDEDDWRPLTGDNKRSLNPIAQTRMQEMALYLWEANLIANRLIELPVAYLLGEGVALEVDNEDAQAWLDAFWRDPINSFDIKLPRKVRELALYGEQCWPAFVNPANGHTRLGYLDPGLIETVVTDPDNAEQPIGVVTRKDKHGHARRYRIIVNGPEGMFAPRAQAIRETFTDGECFYFAVNKISNGRRGRSDLLASIDWCDAYEQFLFGEVDRANAMRAFMWDVTLKGATPDEVLARANQIKAPKPGTVRVHNDSEEWKEVSPGLGQYESEVGARLFRNHLLGGSTMPEHWYGGGGDVNRSTGESMGEPTFKMYSMRQREWKHILEQVATFVINRRVDPTGASFVIDPLEPDAEYLPTAVFPELTARDTTRYAAALQQVTAAVAMGVELGIMTDELALNLVESIAERLGVEFDCAEELERARAQAAARREADSFTDLAPEPTEQEPAA